jgi:hypothetical protein
MIVAPPVDANAIWLHVRSAVTTAQYPGHIDYTISVTGLDGLRPSTDHYRASCDPGGAIRIFPISDEQLAAPPPVPHGVDAYFTIALSTGRNAPAVAAVPMGHPAPVADLLGEPLLSPTYMLGLRYAAPTDGGTIEEAPLRVIATVSSRAPEYSVALADTETIDGSPSYHLVLTPLRHPKENRLRDLWVGESDYLPRKAVVAGNFTLRPLVDVPWTVDFSIIDGAPYITRESTAATLYLEHKRVVREASVAFEGIHEPTGSLYGVPLIAPDATEMTLVEPRV